MKVEFIGGPQDGLEWGLPDEPKTHSYEARFKAPCPQLTHGVIAGVHVEYQASYVYRREVGSAMFYYKGIE